MTWLIGVEKGQAFLFEQRPDGITRVGFRPIEQLGELPHRKGSTRTKVDNELISEGGCQASLLTSGPRQLLQFRPNVLYDCAAIFQDPLSTRVVDRVSKDIG